MMTAASLRATGLRGLARCVRHSAIVAALACLFISQPGIAQQSTAETVQGRVTDDSAHAIVATVMVTRGPDRLTQQASMDSSGNYRTRFEQGTGDYLVYVSAPGFKPARRRVQRQGNESELVANFVLVPDVTQLASVKVTGQKPERATNDIRPTELEPGSSEKWNDGVNGRLSPTVAGDLNAIAGTMSNVTMTPGGPSILGSGAESNLTTLNGMGFGAGSIPRAAQTQTRVTAATFDPTRGGFAGANIDVQLEGGSREYQRRNGFVTIDPQMLEFADPRTLSLGSKSGGFRTSFGADGELIRRALTYNVAVDLARNSSDPATLLSAEANVLLRSGVAPDSVARLIALANPLGLPLSGGGIPANRTHDAITWLGRLDDTRDTMRTRAFTSYLGSTSDGALGFGPLSAPSAAGERRERTLGGQLTLGDYVGAGQRVLTETRLAASKVHTQVTPYRELPGASVLLRSSTLEGNNDITNVTLGGGSFLGTDDARWTIEGGNETMWNARGKRHRFKASLWGRVDGLRQESSANRLGTFSFNSIADLEAGRPSSFSRTLTQPVRSGTVWNAATAVAHRFAPTKFFNLLYGARLEADAFIDPPAKNPVLEQTLGVRSGAAPGRLHISPRFGFTYTYNRDKDNGSGMAVGPVGLFFRSTTGVIRGGIGEFRDLLRPGILADASGATGLAGGTSLLSCVGSAILAVDWSAFASDPSTIPTDCVGGSGVLAESAPAVTLIDPSYDVPRSWRASLDWSSSVSNWLVSVGGLASYDLSQPGVIDANFGGEQHFTVPSEGARPVFVSEAAIDTGSGAVSAAESRRSNQFGSVGTRVSDLRGYGGQLTFGLSPDVFKFRTRLSLYLSAGYTLQWSRRQYRGFDGAGFGDPRDREWAPSSNDARHIFVMSGGFSTAKIGTVTLFSRAQSGLPFTPVVQGDVNGDGRGGDRAFIPNPGIESDTALARQMKFLLSNGGGSARHCISAYLGLVAGRNGCRGPWSQSLNIQWRPPMPSRWKGRVVPNVYLQNVLAGVDQLVHGSSSLRGWGGQSTPDPVLLVPRGFDPAARRFRYDVNPRFANTRVGQLLTRDPFRIVIDFSINLSTDYDLQQLRRAVEPVHGAGGWEHRSADSLAAFYLSRTSSIYKALLEESDSLFLSVAQIRGLQQADSVYSARVRAIYVPLGEFLARGQGGAGKAELDSVQATQKTYWKIFWEQPEIAGEFVTPAQRELMPMFKSMLAVPAKDREHSQFNFGHPVTFADKVASL